jgi:hypothetical protein
VAQQGSPPGRLTRRAEDNQHGRGETGGARRAARPPGPPPPGWQRDAFGPDDTDADLPSWAGPGMYPGRVGGARRRPDPFTGGHVGEAARAEDTDDGLAAALPASPAPQAPARRQGRAAATRLRKSRRRVYRWCGVAIVVCVVGAVIAVVAMSSSPKPQLYVTALQPGEFKSVPSACTSVNPAMLAQYLPGSGRTTTNQFAGTTLSECSFTIDAKPVFRLLEVTTEAYQPFAAASGDGSASANARDSLAVARANLAAPAKHSPLSAAQITPVAKLGQQAYSAYQQENAGGIVSDVVTVLVLDRNVLITVEMSAQRSPGFNPTPVGTLQAGAVAAAKDVLAKVLTEPTA